MTMQTKPKAGAAASDPDAATTVLATVPNKQVVAMEREHKLLREAAEAIQITDEATLERAIHGRSLVRQAKAKVAMLFDDMEKGAYSLWKGIKAKRAVVEQPLSDAEAIIKRKQDTYVEEQRRLAAKAAKEEEERLAAERAKADERLSKAADLEANGHKGSAQALLNRIVEPVPQAPAVAAPVSVPGMVISTVWDYEITDQAMLPRQYLMPDTVAIRKVVLALKGKTDIPGVRVFSKVQTAHRGL